jgi:hypothetical protein
LIFLLFSVSLLLLVQCRCAVFFLFYFRVVLFLGILFDDSEKVLLASRYYVENMLARLKNRRGAAELVTVK